MHSDFYFPSCGGGMIHGCRWEPEGTPKAVIQIVHGVAEYAQRYDHFANFLASRGFLVVAEDHMGHSMGSFLVRTLLCKYPKCGVSAAILSGTAWMHRGILNSGIAAAKLACKTQGAHQPNKMIHTMMFGSYNRRVEHQRTASDWLTRDNAVVDAYVADPLCGFTMTAGLAVDMLTGMKFNQEPENLARMRKEIPVFFIAGADDPVGNYGQGVKQTVKAFTDAGMESVSMRLYPLCRHEVLNELNKEEVYQNILDWLKRQCIFTTEG